MNAHSSPVRSRWIRNVLFLLLSLSLTLLWGWIDYQTHSEVVLSVFYLIPIVIAAWYVHDSAGIGISMLCAAVAGYDSEIQSGVFSRTAWIGLWAMASRLAFFVFAAVLIGRLRRTMESIRHMAMTDSLTGTYNPRTFFDLLQKEMVRARRYKRPLSLLYLDLDNFKSVNDSFGHQTGNTVLETVAGVLIDSVRGTDLVARMGGDEFSVLLPETGEDAVRTTVARVQTILLQKARKERWPLTVSIGAVTYHCLNCTTDDVIRRADDLMYQVKREGKNGVRYAVVRE
jgi:diguanylate cyclase (GGDEF)-like protein